MSNMKYDFWTLMQDFSITVPVIQRDYAQGRLHPKVKAIRHGFIDNLLTHIADNSPLELDFIYGSERDDHLIILDGQQRLSTLFLLHLYTYSQIQSTDIDLKQYFQKFRYETRQSTTDFLESLIGHHQILCTDPVLSSSKPVNQQQDHQISSQIKNQSWYFSVWNYDPSVQGMLRMLDEIESQFKQKNLDPNLVWQRLTQSPCITFYFLEMKDFKLTDELYIKMNARGVHLSEFENFKAWLNEKVPQHLAPQFFLHLDQEWTDVFWSIRNQAELNIDDVLYESFKVICCGHLAVSLQETEKKNKLDPKMTLMQDLRKFDQETQRKIYIDLQRYHDLDIFDAEYCQHFYAFMNFIYVLKQQHNDIFEFIQPHIFNENKIVFQQSYQAYLLIFSIYLYCKQKGYNTITDIEDDLKLHHVQFVDYFNISRRIIMNEVYNSLDDYVETIASLKNWTEAFDLNDVIQSLAHIDKKSVQLRKAFTAQFGEEIRKVQLIQQGWDKQELDHIAAQAFLHGQIGFLLEWSKDESGLEAHTQFAQYADKLIHLFNLTQVEKENKEDFILQRVLLSYGDYLPPRASKHTFCQMYPSGDARAHEENWRLVFNHNKEHNLLKQLLDDLPPHFNLEFLQDLIQDRKSFIKDWRLLCIDFPQALSYAQKRMIHKAGNIIHLIAKENRTRYVELRSYCLFLALENKLKSSHTIVYHDALGRVCPLSVEIKNSHWQVFIHYDSNLQKLMTYTYQDGHEFPVATSIDFEDELLEKTIQDFSKNYLFTDACSEKRDE